MKKIERAIGKKVLEYAGYYPVVTVTGPRQSGKTTLCKMLFKDKPYVTLENGSTRDFAIKDPVGFLERYPQGAILDEIQRAPELLSYIQTIVDEKDQAGMFILTGSQQFELMQHISQSLAGRTGIIRLLPFSYSEIYGKKQGLRLNNVIFKGFFPRIFDKNIPPLEAMSSYVSTYIERDLRMLMNVKDLSSFEIFLKLCAGRSGQMLNLSSLGNDCGVSYNTIKSWISILETSFLVKLTRPYYRNFNKRLVKAPKLYFLDTALICFLLGIKNDEQLDIHPIKGAIFESYVLGELLKSRYNTGQVDNIYYFRDNVGNEVDFILDNGLEVDAVEVKAGKTINQDFFKNLNYLNKISNIKTRCNLVYGGKENHRQNNTNIISWDQVDSLVRPG